LLNVKGGSVIAMLDTWDSPVYLTRVWCIFEQFKARQLNIPIDMILPEAQVASISAELMKGMEGFQMIKSSLTKIDVQKAEATVKADGTLL